MALPRSLWRWFSEGEQRKIVSMVNENHLPWQLNQTSYVSDHSQDPSGKGPRVLALTRVSERHRAWRPRGVYPMGLRRRSAEKNLGGRPAKFTAFGIMPALQSDFRTSERLFSSR